MRIERKTRNEERLILIGMIVDSTVLSRITHKWSGKMFKSRWANLVANWCIKYFNKYEECPKNQIESLFESWAVKSENKELINLVEKFIGSLSDEYEALEEESNSEYVIDVAGRYFNRVRLERLVESVQDDIEAGKAEDASSHVTTYNRVEMGVGEGIDVLQDKDAIREALSSKQESLIKYPGALGEFFQHSLERDGFLAFMGPEGRGKSFLLQDVAWRAMLQRKKVAMFEVGDMSQNQIMRRFLIRVARHPMYPAIVEYPTAIHKGEDNEVEIDFDEKRFKERLNYKMAVKACKDVMKRKVKSKHTYLKLSVHHNSTLSVAGIKSILETWEQEEWTPDVIVIDYADILNMDHRGFEGRDKINETWKQMRSLSQMYHCLVVTATQADAGSYDSTLVRRGNFSEDKRKYAHVTGMIGINQTDPEEKDMGLMRLNWLKLRDGRYSETKCVYIAGCLALAHPTIKSCW